MSYTGLKKKFGKDSNFPLVSILTPTYNRRAFIPWSRKCLEQQDYPLSRIEWIVVDDGSDPVRDLLADCPFVKYYYFEDKMNIGRKRNLLNQYASGDYLIAWDDDDFYPPTRVSHSVGELIKNPKATIAGASECYMWYSDIKVIYKVGPYGKNHGTNGTMAYTKAYKERHIYDEYVLNAEESSFTKSFNEVMAQLNPKHVILITSHSHNTFDKRTLRGGNKLIQPTTQKISDWIKNKELLGFYENVWEILKNTKQLGESATDDSEETDVKNEVHTMPLPGLPGDVAVAAAAASSSSSSDSSPEDGEVARRDDLATPGEVPEPEPLVVE